MQSFAKTLTITGAVLLGAGFGNAAIAEDTGKTCSVTVDRSQASGVYDVTRQVFQDGSCVCYIYTGPQPQSAAIEGQIGALRQSKTCPSAKLVEIPGVTGPVARGGSTLPAFAAMPALMFVAAKNDKESGTSGEGSGGDPGNSPGGPGSSPVSP